LAKPHRETPLFKYLDNDFSHVMGIGIDFFRTKRRIGKTEKRIREYILSLNERLKQQNIPISINVKSEKIEGGIRLIIDVVSEKGSELKGETLKIANKLKGYAMIFNGYFKTYKYPAFINVEKEEIENGYRLIVEIKMEDELIKYAKELEEKKKIRKELNKS